MAEGLSVLKEEEEFDVWKEHDMYSARAKSYAKSVRHLVV